MKILTVGRDPKCDICINDVRISKRHALIKIYALGKIEIVDLSANGTFVNGIRLSPNIPFPVSRSNTVSFAQTRQLEWSEVPSPIRLVKISLGILAVLLAVCGLIWGIYCGLETVGAISSDDSEYETGLQTKMPKTNSETSNGVTNTITDSVSQPAQTDNSGKTSESAGGNDDGKSTTNDNSSQTWYEKKIAEERAKANAKKDSTEHSKNKKEDKKKASQPLKDSKDKKSMIY